MPSGVLLMLVASDDGSAASTDLLKVGSDLFSRQSPTSWSAPVWGVRPMLLMPLLLCGGSLVSEVLLVASFRFRRRLGRSWRRLRWLWRIEASASPTELCCTKVIED